MLDVARANRLARFADMIWLPRSCPECDRTISPAEHPSPGSMSECPYCRTILVFDDELLLRLATLPEIRRYWIEVECAAQS